METAEVDIYRLEPRDGGWELLCYQSPQPLFVGREDWFAVLQACFLAEQAVRIGWDSESGRVLSVNL